MEERRSLKRVRDVNPVFHDIASPVTCHGGCVQERKHVVGKMQHRVKGSSRSIVVASPAPCPGPQRPTPGTKNQYCFQTSYVQIHTLVTNFIKCLLII